LSGFKASNICFCHFWSKKLATLGNFAKDKKH